MRSSEPVVGITGLDAGDNPHPGTAVALALRADPTFRGKIIALPFDPLVNGAFCESLFDGWSLFPWPGDHERWYLAAAARARRDFGIDVLLPCLDSDVPAVSRLAPALAEMGIATLVPPFEAVKRRFKWNLADTCAGLGVETPRTAVLYDVAQIHPLGGWTYPLYVKGSLADAELAHDSEEAEYLFRRMALRWGYPVMIQERRSGVEYLVSGACRDGGDPAALISVKKVRTTSLGKAVAGVTVADPELDHLARRILKGLAWRGPFELEFMKDASNGRFFMIEINGRFPAWISFAPRAGSSVVTDAIRLARGEEPAGLPAPPPGIHFTREYHVETVRVADASVLGATARARVEPLVRPPESVLAPLEGPSL